MWSLQIAASWPICHMCLFVLPLIFDLSKRQTKSVAYANLWIYSQPSLLVGRKNTVSLNHRREQIQFWSTSLLTMGSSLCINELEPCLFCLWFSYLSIAFSPYCIEHHRFLPRYVQPDKYALFCLFQGSKLFQVRGFMVWHVYIGKNRTEGKKKIKKFCIVEKEEWN